MDCKHISKASLFPTSNSCLLSPREWSCNSENCGTTESVWACLSCNSVACGRYIEEHALKHFNKSNHPLAIEVNDLFVYCYLCDDYVLNDNAAGELKLTRSILRSLHLQSFSICETRSGRVLRSVQPSNSEIKAKKEKIKQEDIVLNALCQRRLCLIRRAYFAWKENSTFQKHKRSWIKSNPGRPLPSPVSPKSSKLAELLRKKRKRASESDDVTSRTSSLTGSTSSAAASSQATRPQKKRPKLALTPGVLGLRNLGNTCYLNSILQVLGHLLPFTDFFLRLNISGFSSPPGSPMRPKLEEFDKRPENIFDKLCCEIDFPSDVSTTASDEKQPSATDYPSNNVSFRSPPSPETLKPRTKRLSTSECYQRISRKTCNGLEGGSSISNNSHVSSSSKQGTTPSNNNGSSSSTPSCTPVDASEISEANSEIDDNESNDVMLAEELHALLRVMWAGKHHLVAPFGLLHSVWKTIPFLRGHAQQDAQEFLQVFLDRIERELEDYVPNRKRLYERIFYGEIESQVNCLKCNSENRVLEPFSDLPLEFPERFQSDRCSKMDSCDLYEMLSQFTNTESLGRVYSCEFCKSNQRLRRKQVLTDAEKRLAFTRLPLVLTVHFKRFRWFGRTGREKINAHVSYPFLLDLSDYVSEHIKKTSGALYNLRAVVRHHGSGFTSGHYTAYCWNEGSRFWMHFNDAKAERCTEDDVRATQAYILFYVKCEKSVDDVKESEQHKAILQMVLSADHDEGGGENRKEAN